LPSLPLLASVEILLNWFRRTLQTSRWTREQASRWVALHFPEHERLAATVAEILGAQVGVGFDSLAPATRFIEDLGMDDLEPVEVVLALEEELGLSIPDSDCERLTTVGDLVRYLHERVQCRA
jgi:acyl carrier protein